MKYAGVKFAFNGMKYAAGVKFEISFKFQS